MDKVAVVILNWNGLKMLDRFLPSVIEHSTGEEYSVYVVDNGSTDHSLDLVHEKFPAVKVLAFDENYGFAGGYNKAIKEIEAEYIVLLNSDVEVTKGWLNPMIQYLDENPSVAACQPKIRSWKNKAFFEYAGASGGFIDKYGYPFCRGRIMSSLEKDEGQYDQIIPIFWATGAALFIRRSVYLEVGGLDSRFFAHMEEIDLCWRMLSRGHQIVVIPQSLVYHVGGATLNKSNPRKTFLNFRNNLVMIYKNSPNHEIKKILQIRRILDYMAILFYIIKGELGNAKAVFRARREFSRIKSDFNLSRKENLKKSTYKLNGVYQRSIVLDYYLRGLKRFSQITEIE